MSVLLILPPFGREFALLIILCYVLLITHVTALHISNIESRSISNNCKEVLTNNLECPSIGSFPVAGECDFFARCHQTDKGVDSLVDFCPDGEIFVVNRCVKSHGLNDCPQKACPRSPAPTKGIFPPPKLMVTEAPYNRESSSTPHLSVTKRVPRPPALTSKRPILQNLHPSLLNNTGTLIHTSNVIIMLLILILKGVM